MPVNIKKLLVKPDSKAAKKAISLHIATPQSWENRDENDRLAQLAADSGFTGQSGQTRIISGNKIFIGIDDLDNMWALAEAAKALPAGTFRIDETPAPLTAKQAHKLCMGFALEQYKFSVKRGALRSTPSGAARLVIPPVAMENYTALKAELEATWKTRDLINAPANVLNTRELAQEVLDLAATFNAQAKCINGKALEKKFPLIHAVGKASSNPPQLAYFSWKGDGADQESPNILLVGKGVTFDTGGVQVKPGTSMEGMKKDMGGAATALGLARIIMANNLPVRLHVAIPIAENSISANAFRPSDIITAHDGTEVEIGHTDAEGRLILADALAFGAKKWQPDLIIDFATLTGAQRVADGTEVGGIFTNDKENGRRMEDIGEQWNDDLQLHHMFEKYRSYLRSSNGGEISSRASSGPGATMAAMFLQHFIRAAKNADWFHFDINGGNVSSKPGRPAGGEAMGMRAAYHYIKKEFDL
ncbi:MAG: leucyl aminopeptidase family protein [Rhodospirillales bacterium]|nr:leucyl aminopeptidase family protein [Rhodospirillales bacterium]MCB9997039.1 leucyl aminopeptidase family protein [Rhodospirillales bacterium]